MVSVKLGQKERVIHLAVEGIGNVRGPHDIAGIGEGR